MLMQQLKQQTQPYHHRLDSHPALVALFEDDLTLEAYGGLLRKFFGFYMPLETILTVAIDWSTLPFDFAVRRKTSLLSQDLQQVDRTIAPRFVPQCRDLPLIATLPQAVGCLYVLEGATLGGQIILRQIRQRLPIGAGQGGTFFNSYGPEVGPMWRAFGKFVNEQVTTAYQKNEAIDTAIQTFVKFERWLSTEGKIE